MGNALSRVPKKVFSKTTTSPAIKPVPLKAESVISSRSPLDSSDNSVLEPFEEDIKDPKVDNYLNRLGGSITGKPFQIYDYKHTKARQSGEEKQHNLDRRVTLPDLRELLLAAGGAPSDDVISTLASRYNIDQNLLRNVVRYNRIPRIREEADGRLVGVF